MYTQDVCCDKKGLTLYRLVWSADNLWNQLWYPEHFFLKRGLKKNRELTKHANFPYMQSELSDLS